jgi:hypothetical protein
MQIYSRTGAVALADPEYGQFAADDDGGFDLPEDLAVRMLSFHGPGGKPAWETDIQRQARTSAEELDRIRDPATMYAAVRQLVDAATAASALAAPAPAPKAARATAAAAAAAK